MSAEVRDYEKDLLKRYKNWSVFLHEDQSYLGRNYIALARGGDDEEIDPFLDTTEAERNEFYTVVRGVSAALDRLYRPTRLNYANLRNTWHHCHWHVIPRYEDENMGLRIVKGFVFSDVNPGRNYAPSPGIEVPEDVFAQIHADMSEMLHTVS